jgi:hypothetical protein
VSRLRHGVQGMHKVHRSYKDTVQKSDEVVVVVKHDSGVSKEAERSSRNAQKRNGALKGHGAESIKCRRTESERGVQKTLMQTEQSSVTEQRQGR